MSRQPRKPRTPKQAAAHRAAVAAGKKGAATRAARVAGMSNRQQRVLAHQRHQSAVKAAATRAANAAAGRTPRKLARAGLGSVWILGGNDDHDSCVQAAFANSLYLLTGLRATDVEVLALLSATGPAPLSVALGLLVDKGLAGVHPIGFVEAPYLVPGAILGVSLPEPHTVVYDDDGLITWGGKIKHRCAVEEAWLILWPEQEKR